MAHGHKSPHERGKQQLRDGGYKLASGGDIHGDAAEDEAMIRRMVKRGALKRKAGGHIGGKEPKHRPDRRARGGECLADGGRMVAYDWPNDAQGNVNAASRLARGGEHKGKGGKTTINIHQGDPEREQMAHQQGLQQGVQVGARAAAAKLAGTGAPGGGGAPMAPRGPMGNPQMMPPPGGAPMGGPPMPPPAPPMQRPPMAGPPQGMPMRRVGGRV